MTSYEIKQRTLPLLPADLFGVIVSGQNLARNEPRPSLLICTIYIYINFIIIIF